MANSKNENKTEQIRNLNNKIFLGGMLAELDKSQIREGTGTDGVKYLSFKGAVQCHPDDPAYTAYFSVFIKQTTKKGDPSEAYKNAKKWLKEAVPMTKDKNNPTFVNMQGSLSYNGYVSSDGKFKEVFINNIQFFNEFKEYRYDLDIEGYIKGIKDEEDDEQQVTGRKIVTLISKDFFNNALVFDNKNMLIAEKDIADAFDDADYDVGRTVTISCTRAKLNEQPKRKAGAFGKAPVTSGSSPMVWKIVGGDPALEEDSEDALTSKQIKVLETELAGKRQQIIDEGYKGKKSQGSGTKKTGGFGKKHDEDAEDEDGFSEVADEDEENDDMPF